jgi:hypothetical protein
MHYIILSITIFAQVLYIIHRNMHARVCAIQIRISFDTDSILYTNQLFAGIDSYIMACIHELGEFVLL